jgi:3-hydroxy-9,10-secoandrosta-1,3,5(10)-triene-9,17-dione monooxygenase reductase component
MQADEFRALCSCFATGVSVVTASSGPAPVGMTVSSFTSVSLVPPLILVCLRNESHVTGRLVEADYFGVNVLQEDQHGISRQFADRSIRDRFEGIGWRPGPHLVPVLEHTLAHLICAKESWLIRGDHAVLFGRVVDGSRTRQSHPLIHWGSNYHRLQPRVQAAEAGTG